MVTLQELRHDRRAAIIALATRHGARGIHVYGSVARGQATDKSDLDLLVDWEPDRSLLDVVGLKQDLEDLLGVTVDLGSERGLHWFIRDRSCGKPCPCEKRTPNLLSRIVGQPSACGGPSGLPSTLSGRQRRSRQGTWSHLPWRQIAGLRDVLIHDYPNLDLERIWLVASRDVPELLREIEDFLREHGEVNSN